MEDIDRTFERLCRSDLDSVYQDLRFYSLQISNNGGRIGWFSKEARETCRKHGWDLDEFNKLWDERTRTQTDRRRSK